MLTLRGSNWVAEQLSDNLSATHSSITIDTDTTELSVPTGLSLNGNQLRLSRGGGQGVLSVCLLYTSPSPRDRQKSRMPSSA